MSALPNLSPSEPCRLVPGCDFGPSLPLNTGETTAILSWDGTGATTLHEIIAAHKGPVATITADPRLDPSRTIGQHLAGRHRVDEVAASLGLVGREHERFGELSEAMQQRVQVCRELASGAELVAAFDPFVRLADRDARMLQVVLRAAAAECGRSVVYATGDAETAARAHRAVVVRRSRIIADLRGATGTELSGRLVFAR